MPEKQHQLRQIPVAKCMTLRRNPQYLTRKQMDSLKRSIKRDGFVAPILVRPSGKRFEIVSGNHRFMAAVELGYTKIPAVVAMLPKKAAQRLAVNLNMIHGDPTAELLAPFLAEMPDDVLSEIHIENDLLGDLKDFDAKLAKHLADLTIPDSVTRSESSPSPIATCKCPTCGKLHVASAPKNSGS